MTNQEILTKAIQKAIDGGWEHAGMNVAIGASVLHFTPSDWQRFIDSDNHYAIIFNHDFALALWGDKPYTTRRDIIMGESSKLPWVEHLQQMVIAENPLEYLGENL